jgi:hypothetical protein
LEDGGSKTTDTDDWQIYDETFQKSNRKFNFTIEMFASDRSRKCERFFQTFTAREQLALTHFCIHGTLHSFHGRLPGFVRQYKRFKSI